MTIPAGISFEKQQKQRNNYISIIVALAWTGMFFIKSGVELDSVLSLLPGLVAISILFGTTSMLTVFNPIVLQAILAPDYQRKPTVSFVIGLIIFTIIFISLLTSHI